MRITVRFKDEIAIMSLTGRFLAGSDGPYLRQKVKDLIDAGTTMIAVNFAGVPYIDSTGLGFLAGSRITAERAGTNMVLASVNPHVKKILDQVKLSQFFLMAEDEAAAIEKLKQGGARIRGPEPSPSKDPKGKKRTPAPSE